MNCSKIFILGLIWLFAFNESVSGQHANPTLLPNKQDFPLSISYNNHSWAFPLSSVFRFNPQYPGLTLGTEINYRVRPKTKLFQTFEFGGFVNSASGNGAYFNSDLAFRYTSKRGILMDVGTGFGLLKSYFINKAYYQESDGSYQLSSDKGVTALSQNIFLSAGYDMSVKHDKNLVLYVRYQWIASAAYWSSLGIRPSGLFHVGVRHSLRTKTKNND